MSGRKPSERRSVYLAKAGGEARVVAGGQSLLAMMNLRLASPALLIDIARLPELAATVADDDSVTLGAGVTHAVIEDRRVPDPSHGLMPHVAASLAYRAIRNRGTIGGSLGLGRPGGRMAGSARGPRCRGDPLRAEWPTISEMRRFRYWDLPNATRR